MSKHLVEPGSFRDRHGRIFYLKDAVYRTLSEPALREWNRLKEKRFFTRMSSTGQLVATEEVATPDPSQFGEQWVALLKHEKIPFVSYPYEWSFSMLQDAALLHLDLIEAAIQEGMIPKDATSYNVQWRGASPVFIDIGSFETLRVGQAWAGYRQFCQLFLYPLMLQAYRNLTFQPLLRGSIDGIEAEQCRAMFSARDLLRSGVLTHVHLQAKLQSRYAATNTNMRAELQSAGFSQDLILANVRKLKRLVASLKWAQATSTWSEYASDNSYTDQDQQKKREFVRHQIPEACGLVWDMGCNTGVFSRIAAEQADYVIAFDADHLAVERFYNQLKTEKLGGILPLVNNLADPSPALGWRGTERKTLPERGRPDLVLALALIHHVVIGANVPMEEFVGWLRRLGGRVIIEFVTKEDPMVQTLLRNKEDQYDDYALETFEQLMEQFFEIDQSLTLDSGSRYLFSATPRGC